MTGLPYVELDRDVVEVGGQVSGRVSRAPDGDVTNASRARSIKLSLRHETSGRGDTDRKVVGAQEFDLDVHGSVEAAFAITVPSSGPISYDGRLIRVRWELELRVDVKRASDPTAIVSVLVVPRGGADRYDKPHPLSPTPGHRDLPEGS